MRTLAHNRRSRLRRVAASTHFVTIMRTRCTAKMCVIVADADDPGREHAQRVAAMLYGKAASVKVCEIPGSKDLAEAIEKGLPLKFCSHFSRTRRNGSPRRESRSLILFFSSFGDSSRSPTIKPELSRSGPRTPMPFGAADSVRI